MHNVDTAGKATFPEEDGRGQEQPATVRENNQPITANAPSKPPLTLRADPFWLEQTLANLLENAIRAAPEGSTLTFTVAQTRSYTTLSLHNRTAAPIPDYALAKIPQRFYSLPRANGRRSSGLGLSFVAEIMRLHGGRLALQNQSHGVRASLIFAHECP